MFSVLLGLVAIVAASLGVVALGLRRAPEAYEDEEGLRILVKRIAGTGVLSRKTSARQRHSGTLREARSHSSA